MSWGTDNEDLLHTIDYAYAMNGESANEPVDLGISLNKTPNGLQISNFGVESDTEDDSDDDIKKFDPKDGDFVHTELSRVGPNYSNTYIEENWSREQSQEQTEEDFKIEADRKAREAEEAKEAERVREAKRAKKIADILKARADLTSEKENIRSHSSRSASQQEPPERNFDVIDEDGKENLAKEENLVKTPSLENENKISHKKSKKRKFVNVAIASILGIKNLSLRPAGDHSREYLRTTNGHHIEGESARLSSGRTSAGRSTGTEVSLIHPACLYSQKPYPYYEPYEPVQESGPKLQPEDFPPLQ